jgi:peptidoglycan hydrolase-like protein with peptidoglycan-binding domain
MGERTAEAIRRYQRTQHIKPDGLATPALLMRLRASASLRR